MPEVDFKELEAQAWKEGSTTKPSPSFFEEALPPASLGLASIRIKRWTRRLLVACLIMLSTSLLLWVSKTHHLIDVTTQDGNLKPVDAVIRSNDH